MTAPKDNATLREENNRLRAALQSMLGLWEVASDRMGWDPIGPYEVRAAKKLLDERSAR